MKVSTKKSILPLHLSYLLWLGYRRVGWPSATPHVGWVSGLRPSPNRILQCAASLAAGGYNRSYLSATASQAQHYSVSTPLKLNTFCPSHSTLLTLNNLVFNNNEFNTTSTQHYFILTTLHLKKNLWIWRRRKNTRWAIFLFLFFIFFTCWIIFFIFFIQVVLKTRIVENKDCWMWAVLKVRLLNVSGVECEIVECEWCWIWVCWRKFVKMECCWSEVVLNWSSVELIIVEYEIV